MWAAASVVAMVVCACLGLFLFRTVEAPHPTPTSAASVPVQPATDRKTGAKDPNRPMDLLLTGLIVGAGTKPLHDLVSQIQTTKNNTKDPTATGTNSI